MPFQLNEDMSMHDLVIIGAGPSGLSAAIAACQAEFNTVVVEKGALVNTIVGYPLQTKFFSTADNMTIGNIPWTTVNPHPTRLDALTYYRQVVDHLGLQVQCYESASAIERQPDGSLVVQTMRRDGQPQSYATRAVICAYGAYDTPNDLAVPGADLPKVQHYYTEGHPFYKQAVAVIGGGNSAAEAALDLFYHGSQVTLIHLFEGLDERVKPWVEADLLAWIEAGKIATWWQHQVTGIDQHSITIQGPDGTTQQLANDWVFAMIGYRPDTTLLTNAGVEVNDLAVPQHNPETFETNIANLFVAGVLTSGAGPKRVFIENGRWHGPRIVEVLQQRWRG